MPTYCEEGKAVREIIIKGRFYKEFEEISVRRKIDIRFEPRSDRIATGKVLMFPLAVKVKQSGIMHTSGDIKFLQDGTVKKLHRNIENKLQFPMEFKNHPANFEFTERISMHPTYYLWASDIGVFHLPIVYGSNQWIEDRDGFLDNIRVSGDDMEITSVEVKTGGMLPSISSFQKLMFKGETTLRLDREKLLGRKRVQIFKKKHSDSFSELGQNASWELSLRGFIEPDR